MSLCVRLCEWVCMGVSVWVDECVYVCVCGVCVCVCGECGVCACV